MAGKLHILVGAWKKEIVLCLLRSGPRSQAQSRILRECLGIWGSSWEKYRNESTLGARTGLSRDLAGIWRKDGQWKQNTLQVWKWSSKKWNCLLMKSWQQLPWAGYGFNIKLYSLLSFNVYTCHFRSTGYSAFDMAAEWEDVGSGLWCTPIIPVPGGQPGPHRNLWTLRLAWEFWL